MLTFFLLCYASMQMLPPKAQRSPRRFFLRFPFLMMESSTHDGVGLPALRSFHGLLHMKRVEVEVIGEMGSGDRSRSAGGHFEGRTPQNENALIRNPGIWTGRSE